jgi:hypothetical protein
MHKPYLRPATRTRLLCPFRKRRPGLGGHHPPQFRRVQLSYHDDHDGRTVSFSERDSESDCPRAAIDGGGPGGPPAGIRLGLGLEYMPSISCCHSRPPARLSSGPSPGPITGTGTPPAEAACQSRSGRGPLVAARAQSESGGGRPTVKSNRDRFRLQGCSGSNRRTRAQHNIVRLRACSQPLVGSSDAPPADPSTPTRFQRVRAMARAQ